MRGDAGRRNCDACAAPELLTVEAAARRRVPRERRGIRRRQNRIGHKRVTGVPRSECAVAVVVRSAVARVERDDLRNR